MKERPDLTCYFCDGETECKSNCKGFRAWQDVMDSEDCYSEAVHGNGRDGFYFRLLPRDVCYLVESNGIVMIMWKDKDDSDRTHSHYFNNRDRKGVFHTNVKDHVVE